ncbi:MAG TPA: aromatic hydrocarbon degradation protein [Flavisolibacter sp.]
MKKFLFITLGSLSIISLKAQEPADALKFSWYVPGASARIKAVGGAMGSLGGDITSTFVNPAGLAFYRTGDIIISPAYQFGKTKASYFGRQEQDTTNKFTWGTTGFVIGGGGNSGNVRGSALSIAYNRTADFNSNILYRGRNTQSSYSQKFLEEIQRNNIKDGNVLSSDFPFGSSLAFNTYWIDTVGGGTNGNFQFQSRAANILSTGLLQENMVKSTGGIDEIALGLAVNLRDKWMFGGTIGVPILHYRRESGFLEADATNNSDNQFNFAEVKDVLSTNGVGFNLKAGMIFKPQEFWRLGFAVHSPSLYSLTDKYETSITTDVEDPSLGVLTDYSLDYTGNTPSEFKYTYITPYKLIGSISYVIREIQDVTRQRGFLTADVEYVNYKASSFSPDEEMVNDPGTKNYLKQLNKAIDNAYKGAFNFRAGGELKFTTIMVRLGAAYYGNPYKNVNGEKGSKLNLSGGLGYRNKGFFVDLTYVHAINKDVHYAYRLANSPYSAATLKNTAGNVFLTLGVKI